MSSHIGFISLGRPCKFNDVAFIPDFSNHSATIFTRVRHFTFHLDEYKP